MIVHYWLSEAPRGDLALSFLDAGGREIRSSRAGAPRGRARRRGGQPAGSGERRRGRRHAGAGRARQRRGAAPHQGRRRQPVRLEPARPRRDEAPRQQGPRRNGRDADGPAGAARRLSGAPHRERPDADAAPSRSSRIRASRRRTPNLREQFAWAKKAHDLLTRVHDAVLRLRDVRAQAEGWASRVADAADQRRRRRRWPGR